MRRGVYADRAPGSAVGRATRLTLGFGCFFFDVDLDGLLDLLVVNGHIDERVGADTGRVHYAEPPHLFHNRGKGQFVDVAREVGAEFATPKVGRGAAFGDFDLDGDLDVLITTNGGPAFLYRNDLRTRRPRVRVTLRGTKSNRDGIGARVRRRSAPTGRRGWCGPGRATCRSRSCRSRSASARPTRSRSVVEWPSGAKDQVWSVRAGLRT